MDIMAQPLRRMALIVKDAREGKLVGKKKRDKSDLTVIVTELIEAVVSEPEDEQPQLLTEEQRTKLKFITSDDRESIQWKIYRLMKKDLRGMARGSQSLDSLIEVSRLLKIAVENNALELFNNEGMRLFAIQKIDEELKSVTNQVKDVKRSKPSLSKQQPATPTSKGGLTVHTMKLMTEMNDLYDILEDLGILVPEFVEDHVWNEEYESLLVVRSKERFILQGEDRIVLYSILETPLTGNVQLLRIGTDYWQDAETSFDLDKEAFFIEEFENVADALAAVFQAINQESDLYSGLIGENGPSKFDTYASLDEKLSYLLA
jgi:hypothetical protein